MDRFLESKNHITFQDIWQKLNWYGQIEDEVTRAAFYHYQSEHRTTMITNILLTLSFGCSFLPYICQLLIQEKTLDHGLQSLILSALVIALVLFSMLSSCAIVIIDHGWWIETRMGRFLRPHVHLFHKIFFISSSLFAWLFFVKMNLLQPCHVGKGTCAYPGPVPNIFLMCQSYFIYLMLLICYINVSSIPIEMVWMVFLLDTITVVIVMLLTTNVDITITQFIFWTLCTFGTLMDLNLRNLMHYFLAEKERSQAQEYAVELRHTIANVAHDLKTPLASFSNGIDMLQLIFPDLVNSVNQQDVFLTITKQFTDCLKNMKCTHTFMMMGINRCLDSTKANNNMKLLPKNESIDLLETIYLPLSIMQTIQAKVKLDCQVDPSVDHLVASHIITDKQWLQENILCLLSNAVKYSMKGVVVLTIKCFESVEAVLNHEEDCDNDKGDEARGVDGEKGGGEEGRTSLSTLQSNDNAQAQLVFEVEDEGIGITKESRARLFMPFQQTQRMAGGTGLGLYSLAKRIEAIKGGYGVRQRRDDVQGSIFWFSIPYRPDYVLSGNETVLADNCMEMMQSGSARLHDNEHDVVVPSSNSLAGMERKTNDDDEYKIISQSGSRNSNTIPPPVRGVMRLPSGFASIFCPIHVLIVDDAPTIIKMTTIILRRIGCRVTTAENGVDAIHKLDPIVVSPRDDRVGHGLSTTSQSDKVPSMRDVFHYEEQQSHRSITSERVQRGDNILDNRIDLILMDLQMPVMDGLEATRRIRCHYNPNLRDVIIIGLSANSDEDTMQEAYRAGVNKFLSKPFTLDRFQTVAKEFFSDHIVF
eukprot:scaffold2193_cov179-Ochromonas_danica.AAC.18